MTFHRATAVLALFCSSFALIATSAPPQDLRTATQFVVVSPGERVVGTVFASRPAVRRTDSSDIELFVNESPIGDAGVGDAGPDVPAYDLVFGLNDLPSRVTPTSLDRLLYPDWHTLCDRDECRLGLRVTNEGAAPIRIDLTVNMRDVHEGGLFCGGGGTYPDEATMTFTLEEAP